MSGWAQRRSLDNLLSCEWSVGATDYWEYLFPGNLAAKPIPPLNPFRTSYKANKWVFEALQLRTSYAGV